MLVRRCAAVAFWMLLAAISFVTLGPIAFRPHTGHAGIERFVAYFLLGASFAMAWSRRFWLCIAVVCLAAGGLESLQVLAPGRHAQLADGLQKLAGGLAGAIAIGLASQQLMTRGPDHPASG